MNTITGSWCNFQGWEANCWEIFNDDIYFGSSNYVGKAWDTNADNGGQITGDCLQAFNYFGAPGKLKRFVMMRPVFLTNGTPSTLGAMNIDYDTSSPTASLSISTTSAGQWDSAVWDLSLWGADLSPSRFWQSVTGVGYCGGPRVKSSSSGLQLQWVSTDIVFEPGSIL
jgi:hypothetical protein